MPDVKRNLRILDGLDAPDVWGDAETRTPRHGFASDRPRRRGPAILVGFALSAASIAFLVRAVGTGTDGDPGDPNATRYETNATVLQEAERSAKLCVGVVLDSLPPQCDGVPVTNWDWAGVAGEERDGGVAWGEYHVVGTYDGTSFTLTETPGPPESQPDAFGPIGTPCEEPAGGWAVPDPSKAGDVDVRRATNVAEGEPDFAGAWIDGTPTVLTLAFTDDLQRHEAQIRRDWGGPLCLIEFDRTFRELREIQADLDEQTLTDLGLQGTFSDVDVVRNQVELGVVLADEEAIRTLEERYGPGAIRVHSALTPVP